MTAIIGIATGVLSALASWWLLSRYFRPKLYWLPSIARFRYSSDPQGYYRYQVKLINASRRKRRVAVGVEILIKMKIPNLVRVGSTEVLYLKGTTIAHISPSDRGDRWRIRLDELTDKSRNRYKENMPNRFADAWMTRPGSIDLIEFMKAFPGSTILVFARGYDEYSAAQSVALRELTVSDIKTGRFKGRGHSGDIEEIWGPVSRPKGSESNVPPPSETDPEFEY